MTDLLDNIDDAVNISALDNTVSEVVEKMESTEVNYENVRNIPIQLFDGRIVKSKKVEIETKHVFSTTVRKEKKEILNEETKDEVKPIPTKSKDIKESERKKIPIKINIVTSNPRFQSTPTSTQTGSLSSSVPSLAEVSRKTDADRSSPIGNSTSTPNRQKQLNEIQNDLEVSVYFTVY